MSSSRAADAANLPDLRTSALWNGPSTRRRRYWFADGSWLDQGKRGAAVSFALTQWCADRGLTGADFDEEFALDLHRRINTAEGRSADAEEGESPYAGLAVLQQAGWVGAAYRCRDRESLLAAITERGAVLGQLSWRQSMYRPVVRAGRSVAVVDPDSPVVGGHFVLLDGIDLDLDIDGVRGFVRLKNNWGHGWGDGGHSLISLADLDRVMDESWLLMPRPGVLRAGISANVAIDAEPQAGDPDNTAGEDRYESQGIGSDRWTTQDEIGYAAHAEAIARAMTHPDTAAPLTIGVTGPWGAGKTSMMRMVRRRLEWPTDSSEQPEKTLRPITLLARSAVDRTPARKRKRAAGAGSAPTPKPAGGQPATMQSLLRQLQNSDPPKPLRAEPELSSSHAGEDEKRWRPTVWFNPWMYQNGEQVWSGLAHEIIDQITGRMSTLDRERFWLQLNLKRVDERAVRRRIYDLVVSRLIPWAAGGAVLIVAGVVALLAGAPRMIGGVVAVSGPVVVIAAWITTTRKVLAERTRDVLGDLFDPDALADIIYSPRYERESGQLFQIRSDVARVIDLVATPARPLVIFVDDLDRCNPGTVVQVIEAINLFVAGDYPNTMFVLAMEPTMVAAQIETAYSGLADRVAAGSVPDSGNDLGWHFLEKIVQLPFTLPTVGPARVQGLLGTLLATPGPEVMGPAPDELSVHLAEAQLDRSGSMAEALASVKSTSREGGIQQAAVVEAARRMIARRLSTDSPAVRTAVDYATSRIGANPREIKRFVNTFRFLVMIGGERHLRGQGDLVPLQALAKMAIVLVRWPGCLSTLTRRVVHEGSAETVITVIESTDGIEDARRILAKVLPESSVRSAIQPELYDLIRDLPFVGDLMDGFL